MMNKEAAVEAAARAMCGTHPLSQWEYKSQEARDVLLSKARQALEAAAPYIIDPRTEIGYVCRHEHFQFQDDPDGDACGTKDVGRIYVESRPEISQEELSEAIGYALESHHRKMEEWREL